MITSRRCGVLLHPTSIPGPFPSGTLGKSAFECLRLMADAGVTLWQVLPLGPVGYGHSPYQSYSAFAGNHLLIDLESLVPEGLLKTGEIQGLPVAPFSDRADFTAWDKMQRRFLSLAFERFKSRGGCRSRLYTEFLADSRVWLDDYCLFMALKNDQGGLPWYQWAEPLYRGPDHVSESHRHTVGPELAYQEFLQFLFYRQWQNLKTAAGEAGIEIIGDIPIFIAGDSADVWANPELLKLDAGGLPRVVAGVPPDYFSETGQRWGNPVYDWKAHRAQKYAWWTRRFEAMLKQVDIIRLDHFRGFEKYWEIPVADPTAVNGKWVDGPGAHFFESLAQALGPLPIIAEDLGVITPEVVRLRDEFRFPGMKILQFAFGGGADNPYLPHHFTANSVVYTGTHDNDTTGGWVAEMQRQEPQTVLEHIRSYLGFNPESVSEALLRLALMSTAGWAVIPMQDILCLDTRARMNSPGKPEGNWEWRLTSLDGFRERISFLKSLIELYGRTGRDSGS